MVFKLKLGIGRKISARLTEVQQIHCKFQFKFLLSQYKVRFCLRGRTRQMAVQTQLLQRSIFISRKWKKELHQAECHFFQFGSRLDDNSLANYTRPNIDVNICLRALQFDILREQVPREKATFIICSLVFFCTFLYSAYNIYKQNVPDTLLTK